MEENNIINKVGKNISENFNNISTGFENKKALDEKRNERDKIYKYIGMEAFSLYKDGKLPSSELDIHFEKLKSVDTEIANLEKEIERRKNKNKHVCLYCRADLNPDSKFCPQCGAAVLPANNQMFPQAPSRIEPQGRECVCGAIIPPGSPICMECGRKADSY